MKIIANKWKIIILIKEIILFYSLVCIYLYINSFEDEYADYTFKTITNEF